jgi:hypothetical protein
MDFKRKIYYKLGSAIRRLRLYRYYDLKDDGRALPPFKLCFFCGQKGIDYLNASLLSVYNTWQKLPELVIVTDGTPISLIRQKLVKWPRKVEMLTWEECALYYKEKGNADLHDYAVNNIWGKKLVSVLYCGECFNTVYSDTDVLWYAYPSDANMGTAPFIKMSQDIEFCYSGEMLTHLQEEKCLDSVPLNAGLIHLYGDFSTYSKWESLCTYLSALPDNRTEQTAFAILNNHYNPAGYWNQQEVLIKVDDKYNLRYTKKYYPALLARHYVNNKDITFWRDFAFMLIRRFDRRKNRTI